jgi:hypothetical protein
VEGSTPESWSLQAGPGTPASLSALSAVISLAPQWKFCSSTMNSSRPGRLRLVSGVEEGVRPLSSQVRKQRPDLISPG